MNRAMVWRTALAAQVLICILPPLALADGTDVEEGGGTVSPMSNEELQLLREEIDTAVERPELQRRSLAVDA